MCGLEQGLKLVEWLARSVWQQAGKVLCFCTCAQCLRHGQELVSRLGGKGTVVQTLICIYFSVNQQSHVTSLELRTAQSDAHTSAYTYSISTYLSLLHITLSHFPDFMPHTSSCVVTPRLRTLRYPKVQLSHSFKTGSYHTIWMPPK